MKRQFLIFYNATSSGDGGALAGSEIVTTDGCFPSYAYCINLIKTGYIHDINITGITPMSEQDVKNWAD